jgi:hypothetical protein
MSAVYDAIEKCNRLLGCGPGLLPPLHKHHDQANYRYDERDTKQQGAGYDPEHRLVPTATRSLYRVQYFLPHKMAGHNIAQVALTITRFRSGFCRAVMFESNFVEFISPLFIEIQSLSIVPEHYC